MSVSRASTKKYLNELFGTVMVLSALFSTASAVDCHGKSFHCVNSTHFMICVDLGGGVSQTIDNFYIACPSPTVCQKTNRFECEFLTPTTPATTTSNIISETTLPWEEIITSSSLDNTTKEFSENYINTDRITTVEYSVTTDTTVDVTTRTATNVYINNESKVPEVAPNIVADITTSPIETISQILSEDGSITETTLIAEGITTSITETVTAESVSITTEKNNLPQITKENNDENEITSDFDKRVVISGKKKSSTAPYSEVFTEVIVTTDVPLGSSNDAKQKNDTVDAQNTKYTTTLDGSLTIETAEKAPSSEHPTTIYEENLRKDTNQHIETVKLDIVTTEAISDSNVQIFTTQAPSLMHNSPDTTNVDGAYIIETVENESTSKHPTTIYEENFTIKSTQDTERVNLGIVTTEATPDSSIQLVTFKAPSLTQNSADTTTVDGTYTMETAENLPISEHPTTIYDENFTRRDSIQNIEIVNLDIVTTDALDMPFSNSHIQVTTQAPSLTQSNADTTTVDGSYTIKAVASISEHPTTIYKENFTQYTTQNIETVNFDMIATEAMNIPFLNSNVPSVTTQVPSLTQSSQETTTLDGEFTIETVENAPSSEQPTRVNGEKIPKDSNQIIENVNFDILTTEAVNTSLDSDDQLVMTQAPSLTHSFADTTTLDGAFTIETVDNAPSSEQPTKYFTQNIENVNVDIVTTEAVNTSSLKGDDQLELTQAPSLTHSFADTTTLDGAFTIETVDNAPSSEQPTKNFTQNIENVNVDIVTTEAVNTSFLNGDDQLELTQSPLLTHSLADTTTLDGVFTIETVDNAPSSEQPTKDFTQNIENVNVDIVTTEAVNTSFLKGDDQLELIQATSLTHSFADTTTLDGAFTIETVDNAPSSKQPTIDFTQNIENVNVHIVTTEAVNASFLIGDDQLELTQAQSLTQSFADATTLGGAFTIETVENAPTSEQPTKYSTQNIDTDNLKFVITEAADITFSTHSNVQLGTTQVASLTQSSADTNLDRVFTIRTVENNFSTEQPTMINEQSLTTDTTQNIVRENNIIPASKTINRDIKTTNTIYEFSTIINDEPVMTEESHVTKTTVELYTNNERTTTLHEENGKMGPSENVANQKVPITNSYTQSITSKRQNPENVKQDGTMMAEIIDDGAFTEQPLRTNEKSLTTGTLQYVATEQKIIPTRHSVNFDITTEVVYTSTKINIEHIDQVSSQDYISTKAQLMTDTTADGTKADTTRNFDLIILPATQDHTATDVTTKISHSLSAFENTTERLLPPSEIIVSKPEVNLTNADRDSYDSQQKFKIEFFGPKSELNDISNQTYYSQNGESEPIRVTHPGQYSKLQPSIVEGEDQITNKNWNPFENDLIDKSNQNQQSYNATSVTQRSDGVLATNGLPENIINVKSEPEVTSLTPPEPVTLAKELSSHLKTTQENNAFTSGGSVTLSLSKTVETMPNLFSLGSVSTVDEMGSNVKEIGSNANVSSDKQEVDHTKNSKYEIVTDTKILDTTHNVESIQNLFSPGSESTVDQTGSTFREIGSNTMVSSDKTESVNPINSNDATVVDTKILDNSYNLFSTVPVSSIDQSGSNVKEIESKVNVLSDKKKTDNPKNSQGPITVDISKTKDDKFNVKLTSAVQNDKIELQTNTHDLSETINMRITTEWDHEGMDGASKQVMLDALPLPINNVELLVTNIPNLTDDMYKTQNGNIVITTESYQSATFYPTLVTTPIQARINGDHNTNTSPIKNLPTSGSQVKVTDKVITYKNPTFGGSTTEGNSQNIVSNDNNDITMNFTFLGANSLTGANNRADVSPPHTLQVGQISIGQTNTANNLYTISSKEQNVNETNSPQTSSANKNEPQKNDSPTNLSLPVSTQKPYANTATLSQSVTPSISPVTKQVASQVAIPFTCVNGIRGRYSDKDDCRKFYVCVGINQPVFGNCPENTVFSDIKKLCTKNMSHCIRQNEFKCPSTGRFSDLTKDNIYYICDNYLDNLYRFKFQCQKGYIFNKTTVKCIESKEIESNESVSISSNDNIGQTDNTGTASSSINNNSVSTRRIRNKSSSGDSTSKTDDVSMTKKNNEAEKKSEENEDDEDDEVFICKKEGKFPIRDECRRYYLCKKKRNSEYRRKIKKCGSGRVFHKDKKKCVHADSYEC